MEGKRIDSPIVHLVHGTFAREAEWIHEDSPLATRLRASLGDDVRIDPFTWSGNNSHSARRRAGERLAQQIRESALARPDAVHYIVAHSHGGNVASYALSDTRARSKVAGVACLGTPFIKAHARDLSGTRLLIRLVLIACIITAIVFPLLEMLEAPLSVPEDFALPEQSSVDREIIEALLESETLPIYLTAISVVMFGGIAWLFSRPFVWLLRFANRKGLAGIAAAQSDIVQRLDARFGATPVLVVSARADEAAWWLSLLGGLARFPYKLWSPSRFLVGAMLVLSVLVGFSFFLNARYGLQGIPFRYTFLLIPVTFFAMATAIVLILGWLANLIWPAFFRSHPMGFGWDDFWQNFVVDIESAELPEDSEQVTHRVVTVAGKGLHHSRLHQQAAVFDLVVEWLQRIDAAKRTIAAHPHLP